MGWMDALGLTLPQYGLFGEPPPAAPTADNPFAGSPLDMEAQRKYQSADLIRTGLTKMGSALAGAQNGLGLGRNLGMAFTQGTEDATKQNIAYRQENQQKGAIVNWIKSLPPDEQAFAIANPDKAAELFVYQNKPMRGQLPASYIQMYNLAMSQWDPKKGQRPTFDQWVNNFNFGRSSAQAGGKAAGTAGAELGPALVDANRTVAKINDLLADPNLGAATGWQGYLPTGALPFVPGAGQGALTARTKISQLQGRAFMDAYATLKGGGQITEVEGVKATDALARINDPRTSDADYRQALIDFRDAVQSGVEKLAARAGQPPPMIDPITEDNLNQDNTAQEGDTVYDAQGNAYVIFNGEPVRQ